MKQILILKFRIRSRLFLHVTTGSGPQIQQKSVAFLIFFVRNIYWPLTKVCKIFFWAVALFLGKRFFFGVISGRGFSKVLIRIRWIWSRIPKLWLKVEMLGPTGLHAVADIYCDCCKTTLGYHLLNILYKICRKALSIPTTIENSFSPYIQSGAILWIRLSLAVSLTKSRV